MRIMRILGLSVLVLAALLGAAFIVRVGWDLGGLVLGVPEYWGCGL